MEELKIVLERLENKIDEKHLDDVVLKLKDCLDFKKLAYNPLRISGPSTYTPKSMLQIHQNMDDMMYNELIGTIFGIEVQDYSLPMIRANFGVGSVPSIFGLESKIVNGNMPWVEHLPNENAIRDLIEKGVPDLNTGFGSRITQTHQFYNDILSKYPKCSRQIRVYHTDCQGPFDVAHLIWGSNIYMAMYDDPNLFHSLMSVVTDTIIQFLDRDLKETNGNIGDYCYHWGSLFKGNILLRDDSSVNLSKEMYLEFIRPYNSRIADYFKGIAVHFCGRADQWVHELIKTKNVNSVNFGYMPGKFDNDFLEYIRPVCFEEQVSVASYNIPDQDFNTYDEFIFPDGITLSTNANEQAEAKEIIINSKK